MAKLETIIALSSIIGVGALILQNKKAIGNFSGAIKEKLTFTSPISPSSRNEIEENTIPETEDIPIVQTVQDIPPTKRFEQSQIISTPQSIVPTTTVNRGAEIVKPQGTTSIQGAVRSEIETDQQFKIFSADSSTTPKGVIRQTKRDPRKLRVDSRKNPLETASQRANRVFVDTGKFADEDRGATKSSSRRKFDFGTNTGRGRQIPTTNIGGEKRNITNNTETSARLSRTEKLKIEAEKARTKFDAKGISNF